MPTTSQSTRLCAGRLQRWVGPRAKNSHHDRVQWSLQLTFFFSCFRRATAVLLRLVEQLCLALE